MFIATIRLTNDEKYVAYISRIPARNGTTFKSSNRFQLCLLHWIYYRNCFIVGLSYRLRLSCEQHSLQALMTMFLLSGASIPPEAMMHFLPSFRFPLCFRKISHTPAKIFPIDHKFVISPSIFGLSVHFPPIFGKFFIPYFGKIPPVFLKFPSFLHTFCNFRFPPTLTMMHLCIT